MPAAGQTPTETTLAVKGSVCRPQATGAVASLPKIAPCVITSLPAADLPFSSQWYLSARDEGNVASPSHRPV